MKIRAGVEFFLENGAGVSSLDLQPIGWRGKNCEPRHLPTDHRNFIAVVQPRTFIAVFVDLVGKILMRRDGKSQARKKIRDSREQTHTSDAMFLSLREQSLDQSLAASSALMSGIDCA